MFKILFVIAVVATSTTPVKTVKVAVPLEFSDKAACEEALPYVLFQYANYMYASYGIQIGKEYTVEPSCVPVDRPA